MPNKKSAIKRARQNEKLRIRNRDNRSAFRTALKKAGLAIEDTEMSQEDVQSVVQIALKQIGKTEKKGLIHKNKAGRHRSQLMKRLSARGREATPPAE